MARRILVTSALPYANGDIHLGHLMEAIQADIWVRLQKMKGRDCLYVCADDAHGTAIMLSAEERGVAPERLIADVNERHRRDFERFSIGFDNFHTTHSEENRRLSEAVYRTLDAAGRIKRRPVSQLFDPERGLFLADRYVVGDCPVCGAEGQYGDNCESCGSTYSPSELRNPRSSISGAVPVLKESERLFFDLPAFKDMLAEWIRSGAVQKQVANKASEWLDTDLRAWDISRDAPYFGFEIPGEPGKYFYVWMDAPIGYMASLKELCGRTGLDFDRYWAPDSDAELHHFIGKDIINFHTLFWPAVLTAAGYRKPTAVHAHGFLTVNGTKMSKSRGTFIKAGTYARHLDPDYLRYYLAAKLTSGIEDLDLNLDDFVQRVNADLVGKLVNIASRCAGFISGRFDGRLADSPDSPGLLAAIRAGKDGIGDHFESLEYGKAVRAVMALADRANQYINERQPWVMARSGGSPDELQAVCSTGIDAFRLLMCYLKPVLPATAARAEAFLGIGPMTWDDADTVLPGRRINRFRPLLRRVEPDKIQAMIDDTLRENAPPKADAAAGGDASPPPVGIEDFAKLDLRVAEITAAEEVDGADRLLRLTLDLGADERGAPLTRSVLAGVRAAYRPEELVGRLTVVVANLKPRRMRFGVSEGMILAAGPGGEEVWLVEPREGARPGMRVR